MSTPSYEFLTLQAAVAGRYSLERELGRGGMGIVFLARDVALDRPVAIKLLPPALATVPDLRERFLREARTAAMLSHPNIVPIHAVEERGDLVFFVMAFVDGETLGQRVRRAGPIAVPAAARMVQEVAWALGYAHGRGVIHRDIKPDNILLDKGSGRALVTDFGIARVLDAHAMTAAGELIGTAHYMSPEQAAGEPVDGRSDLYSLGITAFYALTGSVPFDAPNLPAVLTKHLTDAAPPLATVRDGIPGKLAAALDRCMAKTADERPASGEELAELLGAAIESRQEIAPQIRALLRHEAQLDIALGVSTFAVIFGPGIIASLRASDPGIIMPLLIMIGASALGPFASAIYAARAVLRAGLAPSDVAAALERVRRERLEEAPFVFTLKTRESSRAVPARWLIGGVVGVVAGTAAAVTGRNLGITVLDQLGLATAVVGMIAVMGGLVLRLRNWMLDRRGPKSHKTLADHVFTGRLGRVFFRLAGIGLETQGQNAPPSSERTEIALAGAVNELLDGLPVAQRKRFDIIPKLLERLEAAAAGLRVRERELDGAIAAVNPEGKQRTRLELAALQGQPDGERRRARFERRLATAEDLERARERARNRLEMAVAAIETIRLDLLRLKAGIGTADQLTADLAKAQDVSDAVDAELSARAEVDEIVTH